MSSDKYSDSADMPQVNSTIDEQLSAFIDGELPQEEMELLLRRIERNDDCRGRFSRYITIGSVLRGDVSQSDRIRVGVMQAVTGIERADMELPEKALKARPGLRASGGWFGRRCWDLRSRYNGCTAFVARSRRAFRARVG